jgi:Fe-Mn family superoxide dismutase
MSEIDRRTLIKSGLAAAAGWIVAPKVAAVAASSPRPQQAAAEGAFVLPPLGYAFDALEPHIDARTMEIHHDRHHAGYVAKLNAAVAKHPDLAAKGIDKLMASLDKVPGDIREAVRNNGGGHWNHTLFWKCMSKKGGSPSKELRKALEESFGSFDSFLDGFKKAASSRFGSGWGWLVLESGGKLSLMSTPNQDTPVSEGKMPILGVDVWEHAYYLKYQNKRGDYLDAFTNVIDWDYVSGRYAEYSRRM